MTMVSVEERLLLSNNRSLILCDGKCKLFFSWKVYSNSKWSVHLGGRSNEVSSPIGLLPRGKKLFKDTQISSAT